MNSRWAQEHSLQTQLAALQSVVILLGIIATGLMLKAQGYPESGLRLTGDVWLVRHWGLALLLVPGIWTFTTIWLEERPNNRFTKGWSMVTGLAILAFLALFLTHTATFSGASRTHIQSLLIE